jgi:hypothetical protein
MHLFNDSTLTVRQYFKQGYYPSGVANSHNGFIPSGALIKAVLVHSSQAVEYAIESDSTGTSVDASKTVTLSAYPSNYQGYGRIQLDTVLNFASSNTNPLSLFVIGSAYNSSHYAALSTGQSLFYHFTTSSDNDQSTLRVTLTYTDYPGSSGSSKALVNELDVELYEGYVDISNYNDDNVVTYPYRPSSTVDNVRVIDLATPFPSTTYTVRVYADSVSSSTQPFALVVTGTVTAANVTYNDDDSVNNDDLNSLTQTSIIRNSLLGAISVFLLVAVITIYQVHRLAKKSSGDKKDDKNSKTTQKTQKKSKKNAEESKNNKPVEKHVRKKQQKTVGHEQEI